MRVCLLIFYGLFASFTSTAQQIPPVCERINQWDTRIYAKQAEIVRLLKVYTDAHPTISIQRKLLADLETSRAADENQAKSQGLSCSSVMQRDAKGSSSEKKKSGPG
jgi:hypothetical protein